MASYGGEAAAGLVTRTAEVCGMVQMNPSPYSHLPSWNQLWSSTGPATVSWNHSKDSPNQNVVYYDPKRDVPLSGVSQTVPSIAPPMVQCTMGTTNVPHSYPSYSSSIPHVHSPVEYPNYYYNYRQTTNDSSVQQGVANQNSGAAYQPLSSFQNSGSYVGLSSNTYCNVSGHQTASGYGNNSYYCQNNAWNGGNSGNDHAQLYQRYSSDANAVQSSSSAPANPFSNQQLYNQRSYYYDHSVPNAGGLPNPISTTSDSRTTSICSSYSYPSGQPPPPGTTTSWKSDAGTSCPPPVQAPGNPVFQNQFADQAGVPRFQNNYGNQAIGVPGFENQYVNQALVYPQNATNPNKLMLSNYADQQMTLHSQGSSSNIFSVNHASEDVHPILQGAVTSDTCRVSKIQVSTNPRIAPGFSLAISKGEKKNSQTNSAMRPPYVSVSTTGNDVKATQDGPKAGMQVIITKATADGTLHMKRLDIEPLFPLLENAAITTETSTLKDSIPFLSTYRSSSRHAKSRWEPVVEEKFAEKVEVIDKESANDNIGSSLEETKRMGNSWDFRKFLQSRQAPLSPSQRPTQKQRTGGPAGLMENGNASSDSEREQYAMKYYASAVILANLLEEKKRREHRSKRFEKGRNASSKSRNFLQNKNEAANIYTRQAIPMLLSRRHEDVASLPVEDMDWDALTVKGTCQEIEQRFLRLTSAPDPATVRPEYVLEKALHMVKTAQKNYLYKCDQLKSIRQDLTVQRIHNELTVKVYETHACLALQAVDLAEYNQCQSQLKRLYAEGIKGCHLEFTAYNLLFVMLHSNNKRELLSSMASLSKEAKQDGAVKHALAVHAAVSSGNYVLFFKLYQTAPNLNACLMDLYVERMRFDAIKCMSKSYRPTVPVRYVAQVLGFLRIDVKSCEAELADGSEVCEEWLKAHGAILSVDNNSGELQIDTKASTTTLYMPEPENAVAHGDASLAVDDFLTRAC